MLDEECLSASHRLKETLILVLMMQALNLGLPFEVTCNTNE